MFIRILFFLFSLFFFDSGYSQNGFVLTPLVEKIYQTSFDLRLAEARLHLAQLKSDEPDNLLYYYLENYIDFFTLLIGEDETQFQKLERYKRPRLNAILKGNKSSPYFLYTQAEIHLQWAFIRLKFDNYIPAINELSHAYKLLKKNVKAYPDFIPNQKSLGIIYSVTGSVPARYKGLLKFFMGLEGTLSQGDKETFRVLGYASKNSFLFKEETILMHAMIHSFLYNRSEYAWNFLNKFSLNESKSPIIGYVKSSVGHRAGQNEQAISILQSTLDNQVSKQFPYLNFLMGSYSLCKLDLEADEYLLSFLKNFKGKSNVKAAYQKLAWYGLVNGSAENYNKNMLLVRQNGISVNSGDKAAHTESIANVLPDPILLKARLLFDGGYFQESLTLLESQKSNLESSSEFRLEYNYRLGRLNHSLEHIDKAIENYTFCITNGQKSTEYYPCNAALQIGLIYEKQGKVKEAREAFNNCLQIRPKMYRSELHQKAKAGLSRLSN